MVAQGAQQAQQVAELGGEVMCPGCEDIVGDLGVVSGDVGAQPALLVDVDALEAHAQGTVQRSARATIRIDEHESAALGDDVASAAGDQAVGAAPLRR